MAASASVVAKKWGNSIGIVIPKEVVESERIKPNQEIQISVKPIKKPLAELFGTLKTGKTAQQHKDELRKELWGKER
ncbi:AbrB/MazE/SpoVT family DNA-binding domain-containing protein [Candidatus Woesearchaeota archaeon]|nr:AbrB/MazE/SpoVT family DNA-binding domain-containing protein [Candidatus Woesearchaeota archaeon]